jgi:hypothetical protein
VKKNSNNNEMTGRRRVVSACMGQEDPKDIVFSKKRAVLFLGISVLPFLQLRARALEGLVTSEFNFLVFGIRDMEFCSSFFLNCCTWSNGFSLFIPCLQLVGNKWFDASVLYAAWSSYFLNGSASSSTQLEWVLLSAGSKLF